MVSLLKTTRRQKCLLALAIALTVPIAGCGTPPHQPPAPSSTQPKHNWPPLLYDFRFRWTAEPGFDLTTGWAIPLRAYLESWLIISHTDDFDAGYPGYLRATPELLERGSTEWAHTPYAKRYIRGFKDKPTHGNVKPTVGNETLHVLRVEPIPTGFRAFVCDMTFGVYLRSPDGYTPIAYEYARKSGRADAGNVKTWRIEFSDKTAAANGSPPQPGRPQFGPLPAPTTDVFGPWFVTGADEVDLWADTDFPGLVPGSPEDTQRTHEAIAAQDAMKQECLARYPLDAAQRAKQATTILTDAPPIEPAAPGWPEKE